MTNKHRASGAHAKDADGLIQRRKDDESRVEFARPRLNATVEPAPQAAIDDTAAQVRTVSVAAPFDREVDLKDRASSVHIAEGTFLQRSGVKLFAWVLTAAAAALLLLFFNLHSELRGVAPTPPGDLLTSAFQRGDTAQTLRLATDYRVLADAGIAERNSAWSHFVLGVKELIVTVFVPLLTGILGYIFGTRGESG